MKHSKLELKLKYGLFFLITIGLCFGIGFLIGAFPDQVKKLQGQNSDPLKILFSDEKMIPRELMLEFEKSSGVRVKIQVAEGFYLFQSEVNKNDLLFAPLSWFGSLKEQTQPHPLFEIYLPKLFPDFFSPRLASTSFLPLFWFIDKIPIQTDHDKIHAELSLWGFFTGNEKKNFHPQLEILMAYLLENPERFARWAEQVHKPTTFPIEKIAESLRPQQIREYQLSKLKILDRLENLDQ